MLAAYIPNHVQQALGRLLEQYKNRPLIQGMYTAFVTQIQDLEDAIFPLETDCQIFDGSVTPAVGQQLDQLGTIIGIARNGLDDQEYTLFLFGKIAENFSDSTIQTITNVIKYVFQAQEVLIQECFPAALCVEILNPVIPSRLYLLANGLVQASLGAGIKLISSTWTNTNVFRFAGSGVGPQNGFGDVNVVGSGGVFTGLLS